LRQALDQAGLSPTDVGYYNAHGTATKVGDVVESEALRSVWGDQIENLRVSSTKSMHGHLLGAAGSLEAAIAILALYRQQIPPNAFCSTPDPQCPLNLVRETETDAPGLNAAISSSFAFGGTNAVLAFARA
jgi:3-oxoacyl-[acyl-carrier-protein] synthase II